jgi:hypothetical protein
MANYNALRAPHPVPLPRPGCFAPKQGQNPEGFCQLAPTGELTYDGEKINSMMVVYYI